MQKEKSERGDAALQRRVLIMLSDHLEIPASVGDTSNNKRLSKLVLKTGGRDKDKSPSEK